MISNSKIDDINDELQFYKEKYNDMMEEKIKIAYLLSEYMIEEYESTSYEERCETHRKTICSSCPKTSKCNYKNNFPKDILKPYLELFGNFPDVKYCGVMKAIIYNKEVVK